MPDPKIEFLTSAQVAARRGVTKRTVSRWILSGAFPNARKLGDWPNAPYMIPLADLIAYEKKLGRSPGGGQPS